MDNMPERYQGKSMLEIYDDVGALPRYGPEVLGISFFPMATDDTVQRRVIDKGNDSVTIQKTPKGELKKTVLTAFFSLS